MNVVVQNSQYIKQITDGMLIHLRKPSEPKVKITNLRTIVPFNAFRKLMPATHAARQKNPPSRGAGRVLQQECQRGSEPSQLPTTKHFENPSFIFYFLPKVTNNSKLQVFFGTRSKKCRKSLWKLALKKNNTFIITDCKSLLQALSNPNITNPSLLSFNTSIAAFYPTKIIWLIWVSGHCNLPGNVLADEQAKLGSVLA